MLRCTVLALLCCACQPSAVPSAEVFGAQVACTTAACDDGLPCTIDSCDSKRGCDHKPTDGGPCADAAPCLVNPTCQDGECHGPNGLWRVAAGISKGTDDWLLGACADPDGGFVAVGWTMQPEILNLHQTENVFVHFAADGSIVEQVTGIGKQHNDQLHAVARLADGRYLGVGSEASVPTAIDPTVTSNIAWTEFQPGGTSQGHVNKSASFRRLDGVAVAQDGSPLAVGRSDDRGLAVRLYKDELGQPAWVNEVVPPQGVGFLLDVAAARDVVVGWIAVGRAMHGGKSLAWLQRISANTAQGQPVRTVAPPGMQALLWRVVVLPDGGAVALGHCAAGDVPGPDQQMHLYLVRTDASLNMLWQRVGEVGQTPHALALLADERTLVIGGSARLQGMQKHALQWWDIDGNAGPWRSDFALPASALTVLPGHRLAIVSNGSLAGQVDSFAERLDGFGHDTCPDSGVCAGLATCADANPCTLDACEAKTGCTHAPAADGATCGEGNASCKQGMCK